MRIPDDLSSLVAILNDWPPLGSGVTLYLFGSRVRGDHRPDSDVDVIVEIPMPPSEDDFAWWMRQHETSCAEINARLPGPIHVPLDSPEIRERVLEAAKQPVLTFGRVVCVEMQPAAK